MEGFNDQDQNTEPLETEEEEELTHTDKLVGVITEPKNTFSEMAKSAAKTVDWIVPLLIFIVMVSLSTILMQTNPQIKYQMVEKQMEAVEKNMNEAVQTGRITQEQMDTQMESMRERIESGGAAMLIPQVVGIVIVTFIIFFVISGYFFTVSKFGLKGEGTYKDGMVAYGLPFYIAAIQIIVNLILAMLMSKMVTGISLATFMDIDKTEFLGFIISKIDPFSI
ncbi:MAG: hypothetical protein GXO85_06815, partial [Chlorobi bacterium]|nr:hypothetical protein [Chlorobiota bacterium]